MHSNVDRNLEQMLPELDALLEKRLFTKEELKRVLHKRSDFEYSIKSSTRTPEDFLRYIEFEQKLEELRKLRCIKLKKKGEKIQKNELCSFCIVRHMHSIYSRATYAFKSNVELWKRWFAFCRSSNATQRLSKALSDAMRYNLQVVDFWMYAAWWEFEDRQNANMARSLMQQGLRNCKTSEKLWLEYFKLELKVAQRLQERQQILFDSGDRIEEKMSFPERVKQAAARRDGLEGVASGSMALRIFKEAVRVLPSSLELRKKFLDAVAESVSGVQDMLVTQIFDSIKNEFKHEPEMWDMHARFVFSQTASMDVLSRVRQSMEIYLEGMRQQASAELFSYAALFLNDIWRSYHERMQADIGASEENRDILSILSEQMESIVLMSLEKSLASEKAVLAFINICQRQEDKDKLLKVAERGVQMFPHSEPLCKAWIDAIKATRGVSDTNNCEEIFVSLLNREGVPATVWKLVLQAMYDLRIPVTQTLELHLRQLPGFQSPLQKMTGDAISCQLLDVLRSRDSLEVAVAFARRLLCVPFVGVSTYLQIIHLFESSLSLDESKVSVSTVRQIFEKAVQSHGSSESKLWVKYIKFEHQHGHKHIGKIYQRALNSGLKDLKRIEDCLRTLC